MNTTDKTLLAERICDSLADFPGGIPAWKRRELTAAFGISEPTFYRAQAAVLAGAEQTTMRQKAARAPWQHTADMEPYFTSECSATLRQVHAQLCEQFEGVPGYPHFTKYVKTMDPALVAKFRRGMGRGSGAAAVEPHILADAAHPGFRFAIDAKHTHTLVTPDDRFAPAECWTVNVVDDCSRRRLATVPVIGPISWQHVLVALGQAAYVAGGMCLEVRCDNGGSNLTEAVRAFVLRAGGRIAHTRSYAKKQNGKVENVHGVMETRVCATMPGNSRRARAENETPLVQGEPVLTLSAFNAVLQADLAEHNARVHSSLNGLTPDQRWAQPDLELLPVAADVLAAVALPDPWKGVTKKCEGSGVMLWGVRYSADELLDKVGQRFTLRYWPTDRSVVYVFTRAGTFLCAAVPTKQAPAALRRAVARHNHQTTAQARAAHNTGAQLRMAAIADIVTARPDVHTDAAGAPARGPEPDVPDTDGSADPETPTAPVAPVALAPPPGWVEPDEDNKPNAVARAAQTGATPNTQTAARGSGRRAGNASVGRVGAGQLVVASAADLVKRSRAADAGAATGSADTADGTAS